MHIGVTIHATDLSMDVAQVAVEAEQRGFHSLYVPEHTHIPTSRRTPPPTGGTELAEEYKRTPDPYVALAAAAALTDTIRLGTGIALVAQHDAITLAKQIATLDRISNGRFTLGIGFGWNEDELAHHGVAMRQRRAVVRETMLAMQALWTEEEASFEGEFISFSPSWAWPKPVQNPLPILIGGGAGPKLFAQIAEYAHGWIPIGGAGMSTALDDLRAEMDAAGRDPADLQIVPFGSLPDAGKLAYYESIGVTEVVLRLPTAGRDDVLAALDAFMPFLI